ncbi:acylneuraminate cytidylyltransferase family protein [Roseobacter sp. HKCC-CH-9208]|uniref:acylneuraminate cytidylyltransferase family protein n=1 Tax=Roseobacter sp. HKCC-CH-9208 TaxID=3120339 RepID=UPI0030EEA59C
MKSDEIAAVIAVRKFDKILQDKNLLPFGNGSLLTHKIEAIQKSKSFKHVVVCSEDEEILEIAKSLNVEVLPRPDALAGPDSLFNDLVEFVSTRVSVPHIAWLSVTCPLISPSFINNAVDCYFGKLQEDFDSLITVRKVKRYLLDDNGPLNFRFDLHARNLNTLPDLYEFVNAICIAPTVAMKSWRYNWGRHPFKLQVPEDMCVDICTEFEYRLCRMLYDASSSRLN